MTKVRFKKEYSADLNNRMSYELVSDEIIYNVDGQNETIEEYYDLKLLGLIPTRKLEEADGTEIPAIEIFIELSKQ